MIVNDVASVNIDIKLVSKNNLADGLVQLQNGCACCSLGDELLGSVSELVTLSDIREGRFDHIVVECSGVADPKGIRAQFQEALFYDMPIMERVQLDTMITVVDCSVFLKHLKSSANVAEARELFYREGEDIPLTEDPEQDPDAWMKGMPPALLQALLEDQGGAPPMMQQQGDNNAVVDLLVSQTETADVVLLNKIDLIDDEDELNSIRQIVTALNPRASVKQCTFGHVALSDVLAVARGSGVAEAGVVDDHRDAIQAASNIIDQSDDSPCTDPDCVDDSHSHSHQHSHSHSHSHDHSEHKTTVRTDPDCTDSSHSHEHSPACNDPECTDSSHSHSHSHRHTTTTTASLGIGSFVYRARKPFHSGRLVAFLRSLPISRGIPEQGSHEPELQMSENAKEALQRVIRSKGFLWLGDSNVAANYWSHSGSAFELQCLGRWWATLARSEWPPEAVDSILNDFDDNDHDEDDPGADTVGDRRNEIVFIGPGLSDTVRQGDIVSTLNQCLLDESEWKLYKQQRLDGNALRATFESQLSAKMLSY